VQKWKRLNGLWQMQYVLQDGLNIGVPYSVANYPTALNPATGGCRGIAGHVRRDGIVTIYAVTSTISASGDQGADPNLLVKVTDRLDATKLPKGDGDKDRDSRKGDRDRDSIGHFVTIRSAQAGEVFRGVALAPEDHEGDEE
jgi:hypothetical protein